MLGLCNKDMQYGRRSIGRTQRGGGRDSRSHVFVQKIRPIVQGLYVLFACLLLYLFFHTEKKQCCIGRVVCSAPPFLCLFFFLFLCFLFSFVSCFFLFSFPCFVLFLFCFIFLFFIVLFSFRSFSFFFLFRFVFNSVDITVTTFS